MIKRTLLLTLILLTLYAIFLKREPEILVSRDYLHQNAIKAQEFLYSAYNPHNIVVGTSLTADILADSLPGFLNLSFRGQSVYDGLGLIEAKQATPDTVFIESNKFFRGPEEDFLNALCNPVLSGLRKEFPLFRTGNKFNLRVRFRLWRNYNLVVELKNSEKKSGGAFCSRVNVPLIQDERLDSTTLANNIDVYRRGMAKWLLDQRIGELKSFVARLMKRNITVVFLEMPVNPALINLKEARDVKRIMHEHFPPQRFTYVPSPDCRDYQTKDGMHLLSSDRQRYMTYFCNWLTNNRRLPR